MSYNLKLGDVCQFIYGKSLPKNKRNGKGFPVYGSNGIIDYHDQFIVEGPCIIVGRKGSFGEVNWSYENCWPIDTTYYVHPKIDIDLKFFYRQLSMMDLKKINRSTAVPGLNREDVYSLKVYVPSKSMQFKIVRLLDKSQELIDKRKAQIEALDQLVQSVFLEMFGDPILNLKDWEIKKLSELGNWFSGGTPSRANPEYFKGNIPWLSSGELNQIFTSKSEECISYEAIKESSAKLVPKGSLLLGMYDTAALKSTITTVECSCNQAIAYSKIDNQNANSIFVYYCILIGKDYYKRNQRGVRQKNLNLSMIKQLKLISPPIELQNKFANIVQKIEAQKSLLQKSLTELESNFQSLMQKAFRGELFPEDESSHEFPPKRNQDSAQGTLFFT